MDQHAIDANALNRRIQLEQIKAAAGPALLVLATTPLWALLIASAFTGTVPVIGEVPFANLALWVGLITVTCVYGILQGIWSDQRMAAAPDADLSEHLFAGNLTVALVNTAWGSCYFLLWVDGNAANHLFITVLFICAVITSLISRGTSFTHYLCAIVPLGLIAQFQWMTASSPLSTLYIVLTPLWLLWLTAQMRGICNHSESAMRARFEKEALAEALIHARDEAERSRKFAEHANATKTAFLANMSHELRTPLNAILGFSEIINTEALGPSARDKYRDYAGDILTSGRHLLSLINDLLDIAKIEAGKLEVTPQWIEAARAVRECVHLMETRADEQKVHLSWSVAPDTPRIFADERAVRQILFNLVSNAIKFTPAGGRVEVRVTRRDDLAILTIEDTGCGIPKDQIDRVFLPFEQIDNRYAATAGGTGLGLTLVRALSELHGGRCVLESEPGQGTQVHVMFPIPAAPALVGGPAIERSTASNGQPRIVAG
jgi:two-component system cell cycle sensor histidine kinase PleC